MKPSFRIAKLAGQCAFAKSTSRGLHFRRGVLPITSLRQTDSGFPSSQGNSRPESNGQVLFRWIHPLKTCTMDNGMEVDDARNGDPRQHRAAVVNGDLISRQLHEQVLIYAEGRGSFDEENDKKAWRPSGHHKNQSWDASFAARSGDMEVVPAVDLRYLGSRQYLGQTLSMPGQAFSARWRGFGAQVAGLHTSRSLENLHGSQSESQATTCDQYTADGTESSFADQVQSVVETVGSASNSISTAASEVAAIADQHWLPTVMLQEFIEGIHVYSGLPWWLSIAAATVSIRLFLFPLVVYQMKLIAGLAKVKPEVERLLEKVKESNYNPQTVETYQKQTRDLYKKHKTNPFAPLGGAVLQGTTFIFFFFAIQGMAKGVESFQTGGPSFFLDLTTPDALYILPILTSISFIAQVELGAVEGLEGQPNAAMMKLFMRGMGLAMVPLTMSFPKAVFCYWLTANIFSITQASVLKLPAVRKALDLPPRVPDPSKPNTSQSVAPKVFARLPTRAQIPPSPEGTPQTPLFRRPPPSRR